MLSCDMVHIEDHSQLIILSRTEEPAKVGTCARDRRALQQLALIVQVKHFDRDLYLANKKSGGTGFLLSLREWSFTIIMFDAI